MGVMTAPVVGSGDWPAWIVRVAKWGRSSARPGELAGPAARAPAGSLHTAIAAAVCWGDWLMRESYDGRPHASAGAHGGPTFGFRRRRRRQQPWQDFR